MKSLNWLMFIQNSNHETLRTAIIQNVSDVYKKQTKKPDEKQEPHKFHKKTVTSSKKKAKS